MTRSHLFLILLACVFNTGLLAQNYQYLGNYTSNGTPLYLEPERDTISIATQEMISNSLPESYPVPDYNPHYISSGYETDVILEETAEIWVTFVSEGAGYKNVLGFYTYDINNPSIVAPQPEDIIIIFPNVSALGSGGGLVMGDKVKIGSFPANTGIGWVLLANAWNSSTSQVTSGLWQLYSNPDYNPESDENLRNHNVLLLDPDSERIILGFEDIRRDNASCDNDFNDAVFYVTSNPYSALVTTNYADVSSANDVSSGNDGGLESNSDLAHLIAKRNFNRKVNNNNFNNRSLQPLFSKYHESRDTLLLSNYFPESGMYGTEISQISSPEDLLGVTNAEEVFSVDYYQGSRRVTAALATKTNGSVYDHSKVICDRLNNASLEDIRKVTVRGHEIISSKIIRLSQEKEYTLSFSIKLGADNNHLYSFWNIDQYPDGEYYNFQIWGSSFSQVFTIANYILDTISAEKPLTSENLNGNIPSVFVRSGYYNRGVLNLEIINKSQSTVLNFIGSKAVTEVSDRINTTLTLALSGDWKENLSIETGQIFDIGFSLTTPESQQIDALYLADGPWGVDYLDDWVTVNTFDVVNQEIDYYSNQENYLIERSPNVEGLVKGTANLFRQLLPGDQTFTVDNYNAIQFEIVNSNAIEVILMQDNMLDWNNRYRFEIPINNSNTHYSIPFDQFVDGSGNTAIILDIKTIVFSINGDYSNYVPFYINVKNVTIENFENINSNSFEHFQYSLSNYPNPFDIVTTIRLHQKSSYAEITVVDMLGRIVDVQHITAENDQMKVEYSHPNLSVGIYKYILTDDSEERHEGTFVILSH